MTTAPALAVFVWRIDDLVGAIGVVLVVTLWLLSPPKNRRH